MLKLGVDVGGTNTDAVVLRDGLLIASVKHPTSSDITAGILAVVRQVLKAAGAAPGDVGAVLIGTTQFTNALVAASHLQTVGILRLCRPATVSLPPTVGWPDLLCDAIGPEIRLCNGGHDFDGRRITPLDPAEIRQVANELAERGITSFAVTSVFSPVTPEGELEAQALIEEVVPNAKVSLSHEIGGLGLLERENATIVNAALQNLAGIIFDAFDAGVAETGVDAPVFVTQNDGTVMTSEYGRRYPVLTFASGPTNSIRGAATLSGLDSCVVVDVGGTTTDLGVVDGGVVRQAAVYAEIGDLRTNFRMPDLISLPIGGGSVVSLDAPNVAVGPGSVGARLGEEALCFGGSTVTLSDIAIAGGRVRFGSAAALASLATKPVARILESIDERVADAVDRLRPSHDLPLVIVGGGAALLSDEAGQGAPVHRPLQGAVANAVGAAIAQVGAEVDRVIPLASDGRSSAIADATREAVDKLVAAGGRAETARVVEVEEIPVAYLPGNAVRLKVKVVGDPAVEWGGLVSGASAGTAR